MEADEITLGYYPHIPKAHLRAVQDDLAPLSSSVTLREHRTDGIWNTPDLSLPALFAFNIASGVATYLLIHHGKSTGAAGIGALKAASFRANQLASQHMHILPWRTLSGRTSVPPPLSYTLDLNDGVRLRYVFPPGLDETAISEAIDDMRGVLGRLTDDRPSFQFAYDATRGEWVDLMEYIFEQAQRRKGR